MSDRDDEGEPDESAHADGGDESADGSPDAEAADDADPETVPEVKLTLYQLSVAVTGQATDDLEDVEASATRLMDYLVEKAGDLEDHPDDRGLG
jgi:hypothetical protein